MERFPHLNKANTWPGLGTVDPFDLQVTFDPYSWGPDVAIHLCKTRLDAGYENIGGWTTAAARDAWFDSVSDKSFTLDSEFHVLPGSEIKLPIAFEVLNEYNQLFIDFPPTPTADGSTKTHRYYYFISDVTYRSPSSTGCIITIDEWSTHMFDVDFRYIDLERGHAPMAAVSASDYIANPLANSEYLAIPDDTFGGGERLKYSARNIINAGPHWLIISMTADPEQDPGEYGHREQWRVPTTSAYRVQGAISTAVFAIEPSDANLMINRLNERAPQLMPTIQAVFLIPKRMVTTGTSFEFLGVSCREIFPTQNVTDLITLNLDMFGYPSRYRDIAKLYTQPYAWLELTDENGRTQTIAVEDTTGRLRLSTLASILAPFIGVDAYVTGIGSDTSGSITWANMSEHTFSTYGDWTAAIRSWNIPTYAVIQNSERAFEWSNYWQRQQQAAMNTSAYDLAIQNNNLNYSLRNAALDRQTARIGQQQAHDSAQFVLSRDTSQLINAANLAKAWDDKNADEAFMVLSNNLSQTEVGMSWSNADAVASNQVAQAALSVGQAHLYQDHVGIMGGVAMAQSVIGLGQSVTSGVGSVLGTKSANDAASAAGRAISPASLPLAGVDAVLGGLSAGVDVFATYQQNQYNMESAAAASQMAQISLSGAALQQQNLNASYALMMANNSILINETKKYMTNKVNAAVTQTNEVLRLQNQLKADSLATQQSYQTAINAGDVALTKAQIGSTKGMSDLSATTTKGLQDEALANAHRAGRIGSPRVFAQPTGNMQNYTRPQVLMANVKTQAPAAIAAAGDNFLRRGYAFAGRQWTITTLTPMNHFSYWKGEMRFTTTKTNENTREILKAIFQAGTYVWRNPSEIGSISIYDN